MSTQSPKSHLCLTLAALLATVAMGCGGGNSGRSGTPGTTSETGAGADSTITIPSATTTDPSSGTGTGSSGSTTGDNSVGSSGTGTGSGGSTTGGSSGTASGATVLTLTPADARIAKGTWQQYTAVAISADGSKQDVTSSATWNVSDPAVASVTADGRVAALALGSAVVSATISGASAAAPITVTDAVLQSISLSPTDLAIPMLIDQPITAMGIFSDLTQQDLTDEVTWSSSSPDVATVSTAGIVHPVSIGGTIIQASYGGVSAVTQVQVTDATLLYLDVTPAIASVAAGFSVAFDVVATFSDYSSFDVTAQASWSSDSTSAAFLGVSGVATGMSKGTANVTASFGGLSDTASLTVTDAVLQALTIDPSSIATPSGVRVQLSATGSFSDGSTRDLTASVAWSSSDVAIASVSNSVGSEGLLDAISGGAALVTATLNGVSASAPVTVTGAVLSSIRVTAASSQLPAGYKLQLKAIASFDDGTSRDITRFATWTSSDTAVATVYTSPGLSGIVSGVGPGTVTITATFGGHSGAYSLTVTTARLQSIVASPHSLSLEVGAAAQLTVTGQFDDGSSLELITGCNIRSQHKAVASATKAGLVTALRSGDATVLVRKGRFTDTVSVHVL